MDHVALRVADVARSIAWYSDVLGLEREQVPEWGDYPVILKVGEASLRLPAGRGGLPAGARGLEAKGLAPEFSDHEICHSQYLRDPDGHLVEITTYEVPRP